MAKLTIEKFPDSVEDLAVDFKHPNRALINGCFQEKVKVVEEERYFITYIPQKIESSQPSIVIAPPAQADPLVFLKESGFKEFADAKKIYLSVLIPKNECWDLQGNDANYMNAVFLAMQARNYYITLPDSIYACGVGDGATVAHQSAQKQAIDWSGLFTFGDLLANIYKNKDLDSMTSTAETLSETKIEGGKGQLPVWVFGNQSDEFTAAAIKYWQEENKVEPEALSKQGGDLIWAPSAIRYHSEINEEHIAQVRFSHDLNETRKLPLEKVWQYIGSMRRHRGHGHKNLRYYKEPIASGATLHQMEYEGMNRIWYEYVPKCCTPDKAWPLVVVMHGRGGTAESFFDISSMSAVAEERKFIAVFPQAGVHQQKEKGLKNVLRWLGFYNGQPIDDVGFIKTMVKDTQERLSIDAGRIYACGQSSGGIMADVLGTSASDVFAATGSWSGMYHPRKVGREYEHTEPLAPTLFICGDADAFCSLPDKDAELPFSLIPELRQDILDKMVRYKLDKANVLSWYCDPIHWYSYPNAQGVPLLTVGIVYKMGHANFPEESWLTYDQFFSQFWKDKEGHLVYKGTKVE